MEEQATERESSNKGPDLLTEGDYSKQTYTHSFCLKHSYLNKVFFYQNDTTPSLLSHFCNPHSCCVNVGSLFFWLATRQRAVLSEQSLAKTSHDVS